MNCLCELVDQVGRLLAAPQAGSVRYSGQDNLATMGLVLCLSGFAAAYALVMYLGSWISISLGWHDPKFGDVAANFRMVGQILPLVVAIATLSALFGARTYQEWLGQRRGTALTAGFGAGALAALAFFVFGAVIEIAPLVLPETLGLMLLAALRIVVLALPAAAAYVAIEFLRRSTDDMRANGAIPDR